MKTFKKRHSIKSYKNDKKAPIDPGDQRGAHGSSGCPDLDP